MAMKNINKLCIWFTAIDEYNRTGKFNWKFGLRRTRKRETVNWVMFVIAPKLGYENFDYPTTLQEMCAEQGIDYDKIDWEGDPIPERYTYLTYKYKMTGKLMKGETRK